MTYDGVTFRAIGLTMNHNSFFQTLSEKEWNDILGEIDATEETVKRDIDTLKEWIRKQPHLPTIKGSPIII